MTLPYFAVRVLTWWTRFPLLSGGPICPFLAIFPEGTESCSGNLYLCLYLNVLPTFSFDTFRVWGFMSKSLIHLELSSAKIRDKDQVSSFYSSAVPRDHVWIFRQLCGSPAPCVDLGQLCKKSGGCSCMTLCLGLLCYFRGPRVLFLGQCLAVFPTVAL